MRKLAVLYVLLGNASGLWGQFQLQWMHTRTYDNCQFCTGTIVGAMADQTGGVFFTALTVDTICNYNIGELNHINLLGNLSWTSSMFYESPCFSQGINSLSRNGDKLYLCVNDTAGHLLKLDSGSQLIWNLDTGLSLTLLNLDRMENVVAVVIPQTTDVIVSYDSSSVLRWSHTPSYSFNASFKKISVCANNQRVCVFDYNDGTQSETRGVGVIKLDTNGVPVWDTFINPQTIPADPDVFVEASLDQSGNTFILSEDLFLAGGYLTKIDANGNIVASAQYTPTSGFDARTLALDTVHGLVYVGGRSTGALIVIKYDSLLNPMDTLVFVTQQNGKQALAVNEYGYLSHLWVLQNSTTKQLRLDMYTHNGQIVDSFVYWDSTEFTQIYPERVLFDSLGGIFAIFNATDTLGWDAAVIFKLENPLRVSEILTHQAELILYPNPANNLFSIAASSQAEVRELNIYSGSGKVILHQKIESGENSIVIRDLPNGFYLVEVITEFNQRSTQKLIINHQ